MGKSSTLWRVLALLALLYLFFVGLDLMGLSFKLFGKDLAKELVARTANPFVGLFVGVLATTLVQSSSTTTSITVGLVAAGALTVEGAVPIIMGANIGTSVTNTIVSMGHVARREEFRRAFAGATIHDFFNWLSVLILLPIELAFGYLAKTAYFLEQLLEGAGGMKLLNPLKLIVRPTAEQIVELLGKNGVLSLIVGLGCLFFALRYLVKVLRVLLSTRAEQVLHRTLFRSAVVAIGAGAMVTVMVQSSSITTSLVIPLVGAGVLTLEQIFPFTLGANIGTTITAMLAALATGNPAAVTVAFAHLVFNLTGTVLIYPIRVIRNIPIRMAMWMGDLASRNRWLAAIYILLAFYGIPLILILLTGALNSEPPAGPLDPPAVMEQAPSAPSASAQEIHHV